MQAHLREVARGPKGVRNLDPDAAYEAACAILDGQATDAQTGAFFAALRLKGESVEELAAFVRALRERSAAANADTCSGPVLSRVPGLLDCAGPYDGRAHSFYATVPVACVLAALGTPVFLYASPSLPPKYGVTLLDVWQALGVRLEHRSPMPGEQPAPEQPADPAPERLADQLKQFRVVLAETEPLCPPLARLRPIRQQLGVRTALNTAEKFLNLSQAEFQVVGVFHGTVVEKAAELALRLGGPSVLVVQGVDGSEDVPTHRASQVCRVTSAGMDTHIIQPEDLGVAAPCPRVEWSAREQAQAIENVLKQPDHPFRPMVLLNAGIRLWHVGRCEDIREGIAEARRCLDSGAAWAQLQSMQART
ncbi:MAG: anthranilate phosphoribosyltransferase [Alicyclobacillus herbarius]|uniref:anthranilate phosphoribosyltransferase n=1 Tax=Alicyclobacillus herbarius TaxID=122960 RepID=UPI002352C027|nr:anthranilate phosphoribosyltransferase [Alicyclobacillus herbarius]MCL6632565.1 anthranilate phosphoribosyltransferase [Alicyclobacillus herbarius]